MTAKQNRLGVGKQLLHACYVRGTHERKLFELAHPTLSLRSREVPLARMHAHNFTRRGHLEALRRAAVRFQLHLRLRFVSWHRPNPLLRLVHRLDQRGPNSPLQKSILLLRRAGLWCLLLRRWLCCGGAFFRSEQRHQNVAFHARHGLDLTVFANLIQQARHLRAAHFLVRHFSPAMKNHRAHFVAFAEEPDDLVLANLIVVFRSGGPKLYFLQLRAAAALSLLVGLLVGLIKIFAVVGDFTNGRIGRGRNFHQVEPLFLGQLYGFKRLHDAELAALFINHPDLARPYSFVNANTIALPEAAFCDKSPSSTLHSWARSGRQEPAFPGTSRGWPRLKNQFITAKR